MMKVAMLKLFPMILFYQLLINRFLDCIVRLSRKMAYFRIINLQSPLFSFYKFLKLRVYKSMGRFWILSIDFKEKIEFFIFRI